MDLGLRGRRVMITGASKGIGAAAADAFAEEGCDLVLVARDRAALAELAASLSQRHGVDCEPLAADLRDPEDLGRVAAATTDLDVLVNNAGDIPAGSLATVDEAAWRRAWDLKVFGYVNLTRQAYAHMKARGGGVIVNDIGAGGQRPDFDYIAGSAGNAALMAFTRALGSKSLRDNIRVVGVNPGPVATDRIVELARGWAQARLGDAERYPEILATFPGGRAAKPREIADVMAFLASDRSAYTTGTIVTVDGGMSA